MWKPEKFPDRRLCIPLYRVSHNVRNPHVRPGHSWCLSSLISSTLLSLWNSKRIYPCVMTLFRELRERFLWNFAKASVLVGTQGGEKCHKEYWVLEILASRDWHTSALGSAYFLQSAWTSCPVLVSEPFGLQLEMLMSNPMVWFSWFVVAKPIQTKLSRKSDHYPVVGLTLSHWMECWPEVARSFLSPFVFFASEVTPKTDSIRIRIHKKSVCISVSKNYFPFLS